MTIYRDQCAPRHTCDQFAHQGTLSDKPTAIIQFDYRYRCDECGQRWHVTGSRYPNGEGESSAKPIWGTKRRWRQSRPHPGAVKPEPSRPDPSLTERTPR